MTGSTTPDGDASIGGVDVSAPGPVIEIWPHSRLRLADLMEVWRQRELLLLLARRDVSIRYKQTLFGALWAVLQPLSLMVVFSIFLGRLADLPSQGVPYPLFVLAGLAIWTFVAAATEAVAGSIVGNANLVSKVYFPRLVLPLAATGALLLDLLINAGLLVVAVSLFDDPPGGQVFLAPFFFLLAVVAVLGVGLWLAALNVRYRDVKFVVRFGLQVWLFLSPVAYSSQMVPNRWSWLYSLNPVTGAIDGLRWAVFDVGSVPVQSIGVSSVVTIALLASGAVYFRSTEAQFADIV